MVPAVKPGLGIFCDFFHKVVFERWIGPPWPEIIDMQTRLSGFGGHASQPRQTPAAGRGTPRAAARRSFGFRTSGLSGDIPCPGDGTGNGTVDIDDLLLVINGWGACP